MIRLITHLPNELLREICLFASTYDRVCPLRNLALVNKQIQRVAFPLLVRHWERNSGSQQPHLGLLALHLLRYPEHRTQVKTLNFMSLNNSKTDQEGRISYDHSPVRLQPENMTQLARAAGEALPSLAHSSNWIGRIQIGCLHAVATLVLAWATRVTDVAMELPRPYVGGEMGNPYGMASVSYAMMIKFFHGAAQEVSRREQNEHRCMPLAEVQRLQIQTWESDHSGDVEFPLSVFQLPKLKKLHTKHLEMADSQDYPISRGCSKVEELFLECSKVRGAGLEKILATCPRLRVLRYGLYYMVLEFTEKRAIRNALIREGGSLEELHLDLESYVDWTFMYELLPGATKDGIALEKSFQSLSYLRNLTLDVEDLPSGLGHRRTPGFLTALLPASLEELTLNWGNPFMECFEEHIKSGRQNDIWLGIVAAIKTLLEEAGPGSKFNKLRSLDVRQILVGSEELVKVIELGESKGINVLEYTK